MSILHVIMGIAFLGLLSFSNSLWGETVGIDEYVTGYYNNNNNNNNTTILNNSTTNISSSITSTSPLKCVLLIAIYYVGYMVVTPVCHFFRLRGALVMACLFTLTGVIVRSQYRITTTTPSSTSTTQSFLDGLKTQLSGINALLIGNALIAAAQPFMYNYVTSFANEYVILRHKGLFLSATGAVSAFGNGLGYMVSIYSITSVQDYQNKFASMNVAYLCIVSILIVMLLVPMIVLKRRRYNNEQHQLQIQQSMEQRSRCTHANPTFVTEIQCQDAAPQVHVDIRSTIAEEQSNRLSNYIMLLIIVFVYATNTCINNVFGNYETGMLSSKGFSDTNIFWMSFVNILPTIPFPIVAGLLLDNYTKPTTSILSFLLYVMIIQLLTYVLFDYSTSIPVAYISIALNSITGAMIYPIVLILIEVCCDGNEHRVKLWNNVTFTSGMLCTLFVMMVPMQTSQLPTLYWSSNVCNVVICILCGWMLYLQHR